MNLPDAPPDGGITNGEIAGLGPQEIVETVGDVTRLSPDKGCQRLRPISPDRGRGDVDVIADIGCEWQVELLNRFYVTPHRELRMALRPLSLRMNAAAPEERMSAPRWNDEQIVSIET